jgi:superfamily II DNA or RNA helicase
MFERFDGSNRQPRSVQTEALKWLSDNWNTGKFFAIQAPTGAGKSAISKAIMDEFRQVAYLAPNNVLIEQITGSYPELNSLIGAEHYRCKEDESLSCREKSKLVKHYCGDCPYRDAVNRATEGEATAFNPMSYYYMRRREGWTPPKVIVIDEAHSFAECLKLLVTFELNYEKYKWPDTTSAVDLIKWAEGWLKTCEKVR